MAEGPPAEITLPNFLVIGAMKGGTTSLYHYLRAHPQVFMPDLKEVDFFTTELNWDKGWKWYGRQFAGAPPGTVAIGEASTSYTKFPRYEGAAERIARFLPDARLVYVLRHPIDRMRSHYQHSFMLGDERAPLNEALLNEPTYLDTSRYAMQLDRYLESFEREQVLILKSEDLRDDRSATVRKVLSFLGADPNLDIPTLNEEYYKTEERPAYPPLVSLVRRTLKKTFPKSVGLWRGRFVPAAVKERLGRKGGSSSDVAIDPDVHDRLVDELRDDLVSLRAIAGPEFDAWGLI